MHLYMYVFVLHVVAMSIFSRADMVDDAGLHQWQLASLHWATESHPAPLSHTDRATETAPCGKVRHSQCYVYMHMYIICTV